MRSISRAEFLRLIFAALVGRKHFPALLKWWRARFAPTNNISNWDPILISLVRRAMPSLMAYDVLHVQPMVGPTGLIFAMRSEYKAASPNPVLKQQRSYWIPDYQRYSDQIG